MNGKPDTDDGWIKLAHELDAALSVADFSKVANMVLCEVRAQVYGPAKRKRAFISPTEFGNVIGQKKQNVGRAIKELEDSGAVERHFGGWLTFRKHYRKWTATDGTPRFTREELAWIASAPSRALLYKRQDDTENPSSNLITHPTTPIVGVIDSDDSPSSNLITNVIKSDDAATIEERARDSERIKKGEEKHTHRVGDDSPDVPMDAEELRLVKLADHVTADIFGLKDVDGSVDANASRRLRCIIRGLSPNAVEYHASIVAGKPGISDPVSYFGSICRKGLSEPPAGVMLANGKPSKPTEAQVASQRAAVAKANQHERDWQAEEAAVKARWEKLPAATRSAIEAKVRKAEPTQARIPALFRALCFQEMNRRNQEAAP
jgi:hypothetical protein